jgi:predicted Zn-dependent protease
VVYPLEKQDQQKYWHRWWYRWRCWCLGASIAIWWVTSVGLATADQTEINCPATTHPLPSALLSVSQSHGDYFEEIQPTPVGYLIWSRFPVTVYIEPPPNNPHQSAQQQRLKKWYEAVEQAVKEWNEYLPLQVVNEPAEADIRVIRLRPPLEATVDPETGLLNISRAATAQTRYQFYLDGQVLAHRFMIHLSPTLSPAQTLATARHEMGHGLGIWGHSLESGDVMYFTQVASPPAISARDTKTLQRIYRQPTCLGNR